MHLRPLHLRILVQDSPQEKHSQPAAVIAAVMLTVATALTLAGCGGTTTNPTPPVSPLTLAESAQSMAQAVASAVVGALEGTVSAANSAPPQLSLSRLFALVLPPTLFAQSTFTHSCSGGGNVRLDRVVMSSGRYTMANSTGTFVGCVFNPGRKTGTMDGALTLNGVWCPGQSSCGGSTSYSQPTMPVGIAGNLNVSDMGSESFGGSIGLTAYAIPITGAGIQTGKPDTPPPASLTTWSLGFVPWPGLNVAPCWAPGLTDQPRFCAEVVHVDGIGAFHDVWEPPHPNTLQVDGMMTATTFTATLMCASTGIGSGTMSATWTGSQYDGTAILNGQSVTIWVRMGNDPSGCSH
jgi:hypothetical protein